MAVQTITLRDQESGSQAKILAGYGFNCYQFRVAFGEPAIDVLWSEPGFETGEKRASGSGIPLLFPFAGRIRGRSLTWEGREYPLEGDDGLGNAIHGYVLNRPWRVLEQSETRVVGQFQASVDAPKLLDCWPAAFRLTATYQLMGRTLASEFTVENPCDRPLPFGFGTHPYFRVPLGGGKAEDCRVVLPVGQRWELDEMLPTGERSDVSPEVSDEGGISFGEMKFDDVFTELGFEDGWCICQICDPESERQLSIGFDQSFRECVVYNPPHRQAVCIEPLTCVPNAAELQSRGIDSGLRILPPGESLTVKVIMQVD
jgi:aldose 1-epimerase